MKTLQTLVVVASCAVATAASAAQPIALNARTAGDLAELCGANPKVPGGDARINFCHGFAQGVVDLDLQHSAGKKPFCFPSPAPSRSATMGEFVNWVRSLPEHRALPATNGLLQFLAERFPCK